MEKVNIILENGVEAEVYSIFYVYDSKYYLIYTQKEIDENGYVVLHLVQVGKEIKNTVEGPIDTGYMVGVQIGDPEEWKKVQESITKIVEDKKNGTQNPEIQYLPTNMLTTLKIMGKQTFRLLKNIVEDCFNIQINEQQNNEIISNEEPISNINSIDVQVNNQQVEPTLYQDNTNIGTSNYELENDVIIDYRARFFEEQEKNEQLQQQINELTQKLNNIRQIIE